MLVTESRPPRNLRWYHAGPLLFGDWGSSRLYVLGLAFFYTGHASPLYLTLIGLIMAGVAWAYTVVCRNFQDGGGVYAVARQLSPTLSVVGATLLLAGYLVTVAISLVDAMHYFGVPHERKGLTIGISVLCIAFLGFVNWFGARSAGRLALLIAALSLTLSMVIGAMCLPYFAEGLKSFSLDPVAKQSWWERWQSLVHIVLALSGVEAVANMTGLMKQPVKKTAKRTIWPVLIEVVVLNLVFGIALTGLPKLVDTHVPDAVTYRANAATLPVGHEQTGADPVHAPATNARPGEPPAEVKAYRDTAVKVLAIESGRQAGGEGLSRFMGLASALIFGLLLVSAANTAIMALVSVMYSLARDNEMPRQLLRLNYSGVPWIGLVAGCVLSAGLILVMSDVAQLAGLYAVGVCGAISVSILGCAVNRKLDTSRWERAGLWAMGILIGAIGLTVIGTRLSATVFAVSLIGSVLAIRAALRWHAARQPAPLEAPEAGWLSEVERELPSLDPSRPKIMFAARTRFQAEYAVQVARRRGAVMFALFVRTLRVLDVQPGSGPKLRDDPEAMESLGGVAMLARRAGVTCVPIYVTTSGNIAEEILDYTVTFGCDTLIVGKSRRSLFSRRVAGDVVAEVQKHLPDDVALIIRAASPTLVGADTTHTTGQLDLDAPADQDEEADSRAGDK